MTKYSSNKWKDTDETQKRWFANGDSRANPILEGGYGIHPRITSILENTKGVWHVSDHSGSVQLDPLSWGKSPKKVIRRRWFAHESPVPFSSVYPSTLRFKLNESTISRFAVLSSHWLGSEWSACPSQCLLYVRFVQTCKSTSWWGPTPSGSKPNHCTMLYCLLYTTTPVRYYSDSSFTMIQVNDESES
jgi:hypothetical protein